MPDSIAARTRDAVPILATIAFFVLGFAAHAWAWAWVVFFAVPLVYTFTRSDAAARDRPTRVSLRKERGR